MKENKDQERGKVHIFYLCDYWNESSQYCEQEWRPSFFDTEEEALKHLQKTFMTDNLEPIYYETLKEYQENEGDFIIIGVRV